MAAKLIAQGAEAKLFIENQGEETVLVKERTPKEYRCKELDQKIRRERTALEANLLRKAKSIGVNTPNVLETSKEESRITMEFIEGKRAKDVLGEKNFEKTCFEIGRNIGKLHSYNIIHGDLTTSNIMQGKKEKLVFIDFGLGFHSKKTEDKAVDLVVFKKTFEATHHGLMPKAWELILEGYAKENKAETEQVLKQIEKVEKRGRYH
ncbi:MAG: KEOPS complex kinase/ATPase Bud32 [Candidatus ainarchaeum sp.]|nr:KEOPS complex kinase/ATPase Bud32 [Candidatus ainarchaeum sp.]